MVTSPTKDQKLDFSSTIDVTWTSVATDPTTFTLVIVDQTTMNPVTVDSAVKTSTLKYSLTNFVVTPGSKYKFNLLSNDPMNTGILAQSETFEITKSGKPASSSTTSTDAASATGGAGSSPGADSPSSTLSTSTTLSSPSKTGSSTTGTNTANASSSAAPTKSSNAAVVLDKTFGIAGGVLAGLLMLL